MLHAITVVRHLIHICSSLVLRWCSFGRFLVDLPFVTLTLISSSSNNGFHSAIAHLSCSLVQASRLIHSSYARHCSGFFFIIYFSLCSLPCGTYMNQRAIYSVCTQSLTGCEERYELAFDRPSCIVPSYPNQFFAVLVHFGYYFMSEHLYAVIQKRSSDRLSLLATF